jgi:NAD(P)-dependent dehydrogenase (short-subunit alcohol dehydrogenase family)
MDHARPLNGKTAIVTGGGTGIGAAMSVRLASERPGITAFRGLSKCE